MGMLLRRYHTPTAEPEVKPVETEKVEEVKPNKEVEQAVVETEVEDKPPVRNRGGRPRKH